MLTSSATSNSSHVPIIFSTNITTTKMAQPTTLNCYYPPFFKEICITLLATAMLLSVIENTIFCCVVYCSQQLRKKSMVLIVNLSVSGLIISFFVPTTEILITLFHPDWPLGEAGTYLFNCTWIFSIVSPFVIVSAITFERYMALTKPGLYAKYVTKDFMKAVVIFLWLYSLAWVVLLGNTMHFEGMSRRIYEWNLNFPTYYTFIGIHILLCLLYTSPSPRDS